jgi:hypothetical protein
MNELLILLSGKNFFFGVFLRNKKKKQVRTLLAASFLSEFYSCLELCGWSVLGEEKPRLTTFSAMTVVTMSSDRQFLFGYRESG